MVSSGTKEHLDFLTHFNEQRVGHGELSFDKVQDSVDGRGGEIKVNLTSRVKRKHNSPIKVRYCCGVITSRNISNQSTFSKCSNRLFTKH